MHRLLLWSLLAFPVAAAEQPLEFNRDIRPILSDRCFACHGPDAGNRKSPLRLDSEAEAKKDLGKGRRGIVPGQPDQSGVFLRVSSTNKALRMPPQYGGHDKLPDRDIETLRRWIATGARWENHWSFVPPKRPGRAATIDSFLDARLVKESLRPNPPAGKATLLRRVTLDLTGLPPTPTEVREFLADDSVAAYAKVVDRLLASPAHAERQAIRWLDYARYSDTNGYQSDGVRDMSRWRDWVIDAFAKNQRFDEFTIDQIAGDLRPNATLAQRIATGFHRNHRTSAEGGIVDEEFRVEYVADRVETTSNVWLGLTVGCARCHDHKYDPIKQRDFYQLFAYFNNIPDERGFVYNFGNEKPFIKAPTPPQEVELARLDGARQAAAARWRNESKARDREFRKWKPPAVDWVPRESLVLEKDIAAFTEPIDLGQDVGKFNHRNPFTLAAWIKPEQPKGAILSRAENHWEGTGYGLYLVEGKLRFHYTFRWSDLGVRVETKAPLRLNEWQHVSVTYDGGMYAKGIHLYVDGVDQPLNVIFDQNLWPVDNKVPFRIGAGAGLTYQGGINQVRVWKRALTSGEAATLAVRDNLAVLARRRQRSPAEHAKLSLAFEQQYLPARLSALREAGLAAVQAYDQYLAQVPTVMVMEEGPAKDAFLLNRGAYDQRGAKVEAAVPGSLPPLPSGAPANRLGLAQWLVSRDNPLTARVQVNRLWQNFFGIGLVKTVDDFGSQGEWPSHMELLDWLAVEFMESGWDLQHMERLIVSSAAYRRASTASPELLAKDPENRWLARGPRLRLAAPFIRDQALSVSGLLVNKIGGPSVKPYQPEGLWQELAGGAGYKPDKGEGLYRRSLYTYWKRTIAPPSMINFDAATREVCSVRESRTNTPLQALNLMNDVAYLEASRKLAERVLREGGANDRDRLDFAVMAVLARPSRSDEIATLQTALHRFRTRFEAKPTDAEAYLNQGDSPRDKSIPPPELAAWTTVASLLLNLDETITKD